MRFKKGEMTTQEIMEIILAAAVIIIIAIILFKVISPSFDKADETAKSYFDNFHEQLTIADSGKTGEFTMFSLPDKEEREYFLVYFENSSRFGSGNRIFLSLGANLNRICVCSYLNGESSCKSCSDLSLPVWLDGQTGIWAIARGEEVSIVKGDGKYDFTKK